MNERPMNLHRAFFLQRLMSCSRLRSHRKRECPYMNMLSPTRKFKAFLSTGTNDGDRMKLSPVLR